METTTTQRTTSSTANQSEADRIALEHSQKLRGLKKSQDEELQRLTEKHERDMKQADGAYRVEITAKTEDYDRKLKELNEKQVSTLDSTMRINDVNLKQAQETYRMQADELRTQGEKKLAMLREQQMESAENITRKGNA